MKKPLIDWPIKVAQPTTTIDMNVAIRAYSIDVAPERSSQRAVSAGRIRSIIHRQHCLLESKTLKA